MADTLKARDAKDVEAAVQWLLAEGKAAEIVGHGHSARPFRLVLDDLALLVECPVGV